MSMAVDFDAIRHDYPLDAVVGQSRKLVKSGRNKLAVCPFHPDKSPSLVLYPDQTYHCYGCAQHGDVLDYIAGTQHLTISEAIRFLTGGNAPRLDDVDQARREREARHREAEHKRKQENAVLAARERWARALPVNGVGNAYLDRKNVAPYGCRREGDNLLVPMFGGDGLIQSVQAITPDGGKLFHAGAPVKGSVLSLGQADQGPIVVAEGFATGATIQAASGFVVYVGFSKGALLDTAKIAALRNPGRAIVVAADVNGVDAAERAAKSVDGRVIIPDLQGAEGTDFNDQAAHYGLDDVAALFSTLTRAVVAASEKLVRATPFAWRPTEAIPKRQWLYGKHLLRKFVSVDVAAGGVGKSSLKIGEAMAMASGRDLYDKGLPEGALSVWLWNLEDPVEEMERRLHATAQRFRIEPAELGDRLYVDSGRDQPLVIATEGPDGAMIARPVVDALIAEMIERKIDVLIVDPFISSHAVSENDNNAIDIVAREWNVIADRTGAAINLVHHVRKQNGTEATADSARGASSLIGKARSVLVYNRMSDTEATSLGVDTADRKFFFRVDNDKANLAPPDATDWYRMNNVDLANGDSVGVACSWTPPSAFEGISTSHLLRVQCGISEGKWRENSQAKAWAGNVVANVVGLDLDDKKDKARVKKLLGAWIKEGVLEVVNDLDEHREEKTFIVVGRWVAE
jgi:phage/plasmid primase-like uncharacterized protein